MRVNGCLHAPATLLPGKHRKHPQYQLNMRLGGPKNRSDCFGEEKRVMSLREIEPRFLCCPTPSLVTIQHTISTPKVTDSVYINVCIYLIPCFLRKNIKEISEDREN
jgi:hypothetical protein